MIAKLITHAGTRSDAITKMAGALSRFGVDGIETTIPFLRFLIDQPGFQNGETHVKWIENMIGSAPNGLRQLGEISGDGNEQQ